MQNINKNSTVAELVREDYRYADVFKSFGVDFCCGGKKPVDAVCAEKGIDSSELWQALEKVQAEDNGKAPEYEQWSLDFLCDYIVNTHHKYVAQTIPLLSQYLDKLVQVHGQNHPELAQIASHFQAVGNEMFMHMNKEENILFPFIKELAAADQNGQTLTPPPFGSIKNPIAMMEQEHESAGGGMQAIRQLSSDFTPPADACNTYRVAFAKLREFEDDLHLHVHLENNILFPKAVELENELLAAV